MTLNGVMAVRLPYFTEFGKPAFQHITVLSRKNESSLSLSHLLMSFLSYGMFPRVLCTTL